MRRISLPLRTGEQRARSASNERLVNFYTERLESEGTTTFTLLPTPGQEVWQETVHRKILAMCSFGERLYLASNSSITYLENGQESFVGPVELGSNLDCAASSRQIVFVSDNRGYIVDEDRFRAISFGGVGFGAPTSVVFFDGYFVYADDSRFFVSRLDDGGEIDPLDFASAEAHPDKIVALARQHRTLWVFGERTIELFYNAGGADFPFARAGQGYIERGCAGRQTVAKVADVLFFVGDDRKVYMGAGQQVRRISNYTVENALHTQTPDRAFAYEDAGHVFYVLHLEDVVFVFDAESDAWHEWERGGSGGHNAYSYALHKREHLVAERVGGLILRLDRDAGKDNKSLIMREMVLPPLEMSDRRRFRVYQLELDIDAGEPNALSVDATALLSWSADDGQTWSPERAAQLGETGEYGMRCLWRQLGLARSVRFRVRFYMPVGVRITNAFAHVA